MKLQGSLDYACTRLSQSVTKGTPAKGAFESAIVQGLREHALILLLQNDSKTYEEIANFIGCGYRTVAYWCAHGDADNLDRLRDKIEQGNYRKATEEYIELLQNIVELAPTEFGYEFAFFTAVRFSTYLSEQTGIKLSSKQISRILQKKSTREPMPKLLAALTTL